MSNYQGRYYNQGDIVAYFKKYKVMDMHSKIKPDMQPIDVIKMFHKHFNEAKLDLLVITATINMMLSFVRIYCVDKTLETLMIAIDGTPSKGKMIEQRQRRYLTAITEDYKQKLIVKYEKYLQGLPNHTYLITKNSISWNRTKISTGTEFMYTLGRYLQSDQIVASLKKGRPNLQIVYSGMSEIGEAEKKIVNYINKNLRRTKDSILVYSPDADMILLCILLPASNVKMLRHNQQTSTPTHEVYDLIDTQKLKSNISYYVHYITKNTTKYDPERIARDMVCVSTLFGNDFVPKMESINVKKGFQNLLEAYQTVLFDMENYLVRITGGRYVLSLTFLQKMMKEILPIENDFIENNTLYQKYINIGQIKNVFSYVTITEKNLMPIYKDFMNKYGNLKNSIKNNRDVDEFTGDKDFMSALKKALVLVVGEQPVNTSYLSDNEVIKLLINNYEESGDFPRVNINLNTKSNSIRDPRHKRPTKDMNDFEKENYQFQQMLDQYYHRLNAEPLDLGPKDIDKYYLTYFKTKPIKPNGELTEPIVELCQHYLEGILWVFDYYFNSTNAEKLGTVDSYVSTWYYQHERTPLLRHLNMYIQSIDRSVFNNIMTGLDNFRVKKLSTYFNPVEQLMYISPIVPPILAILPKNQREALDPENSDDLDPFLKTFYPNVKLLVEQIWTEEKSTCIDCRSIPYLNKCFVSQIHRPTTVEDNSFLKAVRKIPSGADYKRRAKTGVPPY